MPITTNRFFFVFDLSSQAGDMEKSHDQNVDKTTTMGVTKSIENKASTSVVLVPVPQRGDERKNDMEAVVMDRSSVPLVTPTTTTDSTVRLNGNYAKMKGVGAFVISAFMSGIIQKTAMAPIGILKSRAQANRLNANELMTQIWKTEIAGKDRFILPPHLNPPKSETKLQQWSRLFFSLWKGTSLSILKTGMYTMIHIPLFTWASMHASRVEWEQRINEMTQTKLGKPLSIGFVSWSTATLATSIVFPMDLIRSRYSNRIELLQTGSHRRHAMWSIFQELCNQSSKRVFFRGLGSTIISTTPFNILNGSLYYTMKESGYNIAIAGAVAASVSSIVTHPLDTIKERVKFADLNQNMNFIKMVRYLNQTQGYSNQDLKPGFQFDGNGKITSTIPTTSTEVLSLRSCLSANVSFESRWKRGLKTYFSGVSWNLVKSGGTYASRWLIADWLYKFIQSKK